MHDYNITQEPTFNINAPFKTRRGLEVVLYRQNGAPPYPLHGAYRDSQGWRAGRWTLEGRYHTGPGAWPKDLVNVSEEKTVVAYCNVSPGRYSVPCPHPVAGTPECVGRIKLTSTLIKENGRWRLKNVKSERVEL